MTAEDPGTHQPAHQPPESDGVVRRMDEHGGRSRRSRRGTLEATEPLFSTHPEPELVVDLSEPAPRSRSELPVRPEHLPEHRPEPPLPEKRPSIFRSFRAWWRHESLARAAEKRALATAEAIVRAQAIQAATTPVDKLPAPDPGSIQNVLAFTDERFQSLGLRSDRLHDELTGISRTLNDLRGLLSAGASAKRVAGAAAEAVGTLEERFDSLLVALSEELQRRSEETERRISEQITLQSAELAALLESAVTRISASIPQEFERVRAQIPKEMDRFHAVIPGEMERIRGVIPKEMQRLREQNRQELDAVLSMTQKQLDLLRAFSREELGKIRRAIPEELGKIPVSEAVPHEIAEIREMLPRELEKVRAAIPEEMEKLRLTIPEEMERTRAMIPEVIERTATANAEELERIRWATNDRLDRIREEIAEAASGLARAIEEVPAVPAQASAVPEPPPVPEPPADPLEPRLTELLVAINRNTDRLADAMHREMRAIEGQIRRRSEPS